MRHTVLTSFLLAFVFLEISPPARGQSKPVSASVKLPSVEVFIWERAGSLVAFDPQGQPVQIAVIPGDLVEVELLNTPGLEPTRQLILANWKSVWEWKERAGGFKGFFGGKKTVEKPTKKPKTGMLGEQLVFYLNLPAFSGASQTPKLAIKPTPSNQTVGMALQPGTIGLTGTVGSIQLGPGEEQPPHAGAKRKSGPDREPGVGIEGQRLYHLRINVTRPASNQGTP